MTGNKLSAQFISGKTLFLVILICFLSVLFIRIRLINVYTQNIGGMEQNVIFSIQTLASGTSLYTNPEKPLYSITQYSPLYFHILAFTGKAAGLDPAETIQWYRLSRFVSLLLNLLLLVVVYCILKLFKSGSKLIDIGLPLMLFIFFEQQDYSRPDSMYHLFFALTILFFFKTILNKQTAISLALTGVSLALALFSKQNGAFLLVLITTFLVFTSAVRKKLPWFFISFLATVLVLYFLFLSEGKEFLWKNLYLSVMNGLDLRWAIKLYFLAAFPRFVLFFLTFILLLLFWKELNSPVEKLTTISAVYYLAIALFSGLKWGSGTNYFFEFCLLLIPGMLFLYQYALRNNYEKKLLRKISLALLITMVVPQLLIIAWRDYYKSDPKSYYAARETVNIIEKQSWFNPQTRFAIPDRNWISAFLFNRTLFSQPDIYRTLWNPDPMQSALHPEKLSQNENIFLIRSTNESFAGYFNLNLTGYTPVMQHDIYQVFRPPLK